MKKILPIFFVTTVFLNSCLRLDTNLYNNMKLAHYDLDSTTADQEITIDASYHIPDSLVRIFPLVSDDNGNKATIYAEYLGDMNRIATDTVILYFHGNKGHMDFYWNRSKLLANTGGKNRFGVMVIDYRGYGMSEGKPTESGMYADGEAALEWLKSKGLTGDRLILYGFSLGTSVATYKTANPGALKPAKLVLEAPFASAATMVQNASLLAIPPSYFTNLSVNNADEIKKVQQPFMWLHGTADPFLNINTNGEVVYKNYQGTYKEAHRIPLATHTNVPSVWGYGNYQAALLAFIRR
jgi:pimeloyl-ACP methyl ester carboxylesterase